MTKGLLGAVVLAVKNISLFRIWGLGVWSYFLSPPESDYLASLLHGNLWYHPNRDTGLKMCISFEIPGTRPMQTLFPLRLCQTNCQCQANSFWGGHWTATATLTVFTYLIYALNSTNYHVVINTQLLVLTETRNLHLSTTWIPWSSSKRDISQRDISYQRGLISDWAHF